MNNSSLLQVVIEYDWLGNKEIRSVYHCSPATASKRLNEIRVYAEEQKEGCTKRYIHRKVPTSIFLEYIGKSLDDLIKYEKKKQTIECLLQNKKTS